MNIRHYFRALRRNSNRVKQATGKDRFTQIREMLSMKTLNPTLGTFDYFVFRIHQLSRADRSNITDYLGWRVQEQLAQILNSRAAVMPAWDKFTYHLYAAALDIPVPTVVAFFRPNSTRCWHLPGTFLRTPEELADWLRRNNTWPLFAKPCYSQQSMGCYCLAAYAAEDDALVTEDGQRLPVEGFVKDVVLAPNGPFFRQDMGYLFQQVLRPHADVVALTGSRATSCIRVVIVQDDGRQEIVAAVWKLIRGANISDTRIDDALGHIHAPVDLPTGRLGAARKDYEELSYPIHPDTGIAIEGFQVPYWEEAVATCLSAASVFPMLHIQHWDLAVTESGPCLLEINDIGAIEFLQKFGRGLLTPFFKGVLLRHGDGRRHPWLRQICS